MSNTRLMGGIVLAAVTLTGCGMTGSQDPVPELKAELTASRPPDFVAPDAEGARIWKLVRRFYEGHRYTYAWIAGRRARPQMHDLIDALAAAGREGLDPDIYSVRLIAERRDEASRGFLRGKGFDPVDAAHLDAWLTYLFLKYADDLADGMTELARTDPSWQIRPPKVDLLAVLESALDSGRVVETLQELSPRHPEYIALRASLERHREIAPAGGQPDARIRQIALNIERWRWLPRDLGSSYITVNIPEFRLQVWERDRVVHDMKVVVGTADNPTPMFSDEMTSVVFSPYWNVPPAIARDETLPAALNDPGYLARNNIEIVDPDGRVVDPSAVDWFAADGYRFRQRPGPGNALGHVKFVFPNQFNVYLHDTPADSLFERVSRAFSHGCVRVEQPELLARYVLRDHAEWTPERMAAAMQSGKEQHVKLARPLPVHLVYWTVRAGADGTTAFFKDIYGIDASQSQAYEARLKRLRARAAKAETAVPPQKRP